jgi:hypothetical protein
MEKRVIKQKRVPGFEYSTPVLRRQKILKNEKDSIQEPKIPLKSTKKLRMSQNVSHRAVIEAPPNSPILNQDLNLKKKSNPQNNATALSPATPNNQDTLNEENIDYFLNKIYKLKSSPAAYSAAIQKYIDKNYSLSLHKQRRKRFR